MSEPLETVRSRLEACGQQHLLSFWDRLDAAGRRRLLDQVESLDWAALRRMRDLLRRPPSAAPVLHDAEPAAVAVLEGAERREARAHGEAALRAGEVGLLMVAGGQGTRLGFSGPKALFPIAPLTGATLLEVHARKVLALERRYGRPLPFYIMTSPEHDAAIRSFLETRAWLGLGPDRVRCFPQGMWPALFPDGRIVMDRPDHIFLSPDGHGGVLAALRAHGLFDDMRRRGVTTLYYFQVDNPLLDIADPVLIGLHRLRAAQMSVKVCAKRDPEEGLGVVVRRGGRHAVVEYSELTREQKHERLPDGRLRLLYGSVAIHAFDRAFLESEAEADLPLHMAHKKVPYCDEQGRTRQPSEPNAFKFEKFIFDILPHAERTVNLAFDRADEFSPVKNATGMDSPDTARRDLIRKHARWLEAAGVRVPRSPDGEPTVRIEIDPCLALDADELRERLRRPFEITGDLLLAEGDARFRP